MWLHWVFFCPWHLSPANWKHPGTVSWCDLCMENPGRCFVCAAFNSPALGEDLASWAHSWSFCKLRDLTTGKFHHGKGRSRLGAWPSSLKLQQELKTNQSQSPRRWSSEQGLEIPAAQGSAPTALCKNRMGKTHWRHSRAWTNPRYPDLCCSSLHSYKSNWEQRCQSSLSSLEFNDTSSLNGKEKKITISIVSAPNKILFMSIFEFQNPPDLLKVSLFPLSVFVGGNATLQLSATPSPHWISAQSFSSLEYSHFPHTRHPMWSVWCLEGCCLSTPLNVAPILFSLQSLWALEQFLWKPEICIARGTGMPRHPAKSMLELARNRQKEHTMCYASISALKKMQDIWIYHPRQAKERILEKSSARGMDLWHCKRSW